jgi:hypothetical protein
VLKIRHIAKPKNIIPSIPLNLTPPPHSRQVKQMITTIGLEKNP